MIYADDVNLMGKKHNKEKKQTHLLHTSKLHQSVQPICNYTSSCKASYSIWLLAVTVM